MFRTLNKTVLESILACGVGLLITAFTFVELQKREEREVASLMHERASGLINNLQKKMFLYQYGLRGLRGAYISIDSNYLTSKKFEQYSSSRNYKKEFPGAMGFGFIRRVSPHQESSFLKEMRADQRPQFSIKQLEPNSADKYVIELIHPLDENSQAIGLDIASEHNRFMAAQKSMRTGQIGITAPITLVQKANRRSSGFLILLPYYSTNGIPTSLEERERRLLGWVYAPLVIDQVLDDYEIKHREEIVELLDVTSAQQPISFFKSAPLSKERRSTNQPQLKAINFKAIGESVLETTVFGRKWQLRYTAGELLAKHTGLPSKGLVSSFGVFISILLGFVWYFWSNNRQQEKWVNESNAKLAAIVDSSQDAIIGKDLKGYVLSWNKGAESLFGYSENEAIGKKVVDLIIPQDLHHEESSILKSISNGETLQHFETLRVNKWGEKLQVSVSVSPVRDDSGNIVYASKTVRNITAQKEAEQRIIQLNRNLELKVLERTEQLASMTELLQRTGEMAKIGGWELDLVTKELKWSKEIFAIHEIDADEPPPLEKALNFYAPKAVPVITEAINQALAVGTPWDLELPFITAKGNHIWVRAQGAVVKNQDKAVRLIGAFQDITERKKSEIDLAWVNRALQMLGKCNELLIHIKNETQLITEVCRIAVVIGGYRMAWVGYAENDEYKSISPQAHFGHSEGFLNKIKLSWSEHDANGRGPGGNTIRRGHAVVVEDLLENDSYPAKKEALEQGYRSLVSLPLKNKEKTFGLLALYLGEAHHFAHDELRLLQDLADNLAAGIVNIRLESERQQLQNAMLKVATAVSVTSGETFFSQLVTNMVHALGAKAGYASRFLSEKPLTAKTIAAVVDHKIINNFEYSIPDALAEELFSTTDLRIVPEHADRDFPNMSMMKFGDFQAFAGLCIYNSNNQAIGLLFVFFDEPILQKSQVLIESTLKIFAARIASELDRQASAAAIAENARFIKTVTDAMPAMVAYWDRDLLCRFANKPYLQWFGKPPEAILGTSIHSLLGETLFKMNEQYIRGALAGEFQQFERTLTKADGSIGYTWTNYIPDIDTQGTVNGFYVLVTDVTPIIKAENQLKLAASVFQNTIEGIMVTDINHVILSVNPAFTTISGFSADDVLGHTPRLLNSGYHPKSFFDDMQASLTELRVWKGEIWNRRQNGEIYPANMTITAVADSNDEVTNYVGIFSDNTEYKLHEEQRLADESNQRDALVREVHHRIKNNLQSVASLLSNFSAQHPQLSEPLNTAITQVKSIAAVHGLQGQFVNSSVGLRGLIEAISTNNQLLWNTQVVLNIPTDAPVILVEEKESVPLALVMNELMTNAIKHGDQSQVAIDLAYDEGSDKVSIIIRNKGKLSLDPVKMTPNFGTGLQLATVLLPKKNAILSWEQAGEFVITRIDLTAPIIEIGLRSH
jgi:PAS domain S-box-containing protein